MAERNNLDLNSDPRSIIGTRELAMLRSRQRQQRLAQSVGAAGVDQELKRDVSFLPYRVRLAQQGAPRRGDDQPAAAPVVLVDGDLQQAAPLERLQIRGQRRAV